MKIPYKALKAVLIFAPKSDVRYYLEGVLLESTGTEVRLVATDGHCLALYRLDEKAPIGKVILPYDDVKAALSVPKTIADKEIPFEVELADLNLAVGRPKVTITHGNGTVQSFRTVGGKFPDYLRVLPRTVSGEPAQFNPEYLNRFAQADRILGWLKRSEEPRVYIHYNGNAAALVECKHDVSFLGVVMPEYPHRQRSPADLTSGLPESCN